jgi:hypothetical protein
MARQHEKISARRFLSYISQPGLADVDNGKLREGVAYPRG